MYLFNVGYVPFGNPVAATLLLRLLFREIMPMAVTWQFVLEKVEQRCGYLLTSGQWADCTLVVESEPEVKVPAHKLILSMASPVFRKMLYEGLPERNKPMIRVPDVDLDTFRALLQYIYTDHIHIVSFDMAQNLGRGAINYKLPHLMNTCTSYICSVVSPRNVCQAYKLARFGEVKTLMDKCIEIMSRKTKEVLNDSSFEDVELDTLMTVLSLDHLNVDSEVDLIHAVVRYVEAEQKRQGQNSTPVDNKPPSEKLSELRLEPTPSDKKVLLNGECSSLTSSVESDSEPANKVLTSPTAEPNSEPANKVLTSPTVESNSEPANKVLTSPTAEPNSEPANKVLTSPTAEPDSELANKVLTSEPTVNRSNLKQEGRRPAGIRAAIEKIRFLSLTPKQFAESHLRYGLLTDGEAYAVLMNIASTNSVEPMPNGFCKTREKRQLRSDVVDEEPNVKPLLQPSTESRSIAAIELSTPADIVEDLQSRDRETLEQAARAARHMTSADGDDTSKNIIQLVAADCIPRLVTALDHPCTGVQYDAASAIANIARKRKHSWELVKTGAPSKLVVLLGRGGAVAEQAARALGNMAARGSTARDPIVNAGALPALLAYMHPNTPSGPLATYVWAYRMICEYLNYPFGWTSIPYISNLLQLADEQVLVEACGVLELLAGGAAYDSEPFTPTLVTRLTALLQPAAAPRVQTAALDALERMLRITVLRDRCLGAGCLDHIINFLKCGNHSHVKTAAEAIAHILDTPNNIQQALDRGILEALVPALTEGDNDCKCSASFALCNLCEYGSPSQLSELAVSAALEPYCLLLANQDGPLFTTYNNVLVGVTYLVKRIEQDTKVALLLKLREIGVPQLLIPLQRSENRIVRERVADLLRALHNDQ